MAPKFFPKRRISALLCLLNKKQPVVGCFLMVEPLSVPIATLSVAGATGFSAKGGSAAGGEPT
jgi:hypothetical protein